MKSYIKEEKRRKTERRKLRKSERRKKTKKDEKMTTKTSQKLRKRRKGQKLKTIHSEEQQNRLSSPERVSEGDNLIPVFSAAQEVINGKD